MNAKPKTAALLICCAFFAVSCNKDPNNGTPDGLDKFVITTRVPLNSTYVTKKLYVGTFKDLSIKDYTNAKARYHPDTHWPIIKLYKDLVFVLPSGELNNAVKKYRRRPDGSLSDAGSMTVSDATEVPDMVIENDTKGYISLLQAGKIAVFNPSTMQIINYIDLKSYTKGNDGSPDPANLLLRNNKLYVACQQKMPAWEVSAWPAQVLIIDLADGNRIDSTNDSRSTLAGNDRDPRSMFFDENGDLYVFCQASYGGQALQKCGFLRIRNGQTKFDPGYFFNVADYEVLTIAGSRIRNFHHMQYVDKGILYGSGNVYELSFLGDYANKTFASFKVDLANKVITKLDLPYSNGYAGSVLAYQNKIYWGLATLDGVGIYSYDPATNLASADPAVNTEGDPLGFDAF